MGKFEYCFVDGCEQLSGERFVEFSYLSVPLQTGDAVGQSETVTFRVPLCERHYVLMSEFVTRFMRREWKV